MNLFWKAHHVVANLIYRFPLTQKPSCIWYVHRRYGFALSDTRALWSRAEAELVPGKHNFLGYEEDVASKFFSLAASRMYDECETYLCVEGCCSVQWFNGKNVGGFGPAGCPCNGLKDPRDLTRGAVS